MPPRSPPQRHVVWRLVGALLRAYDIAADPERQPSPLWLSAVADVTDNLLTELDSTGREVKVIADTAAVVSASLPEAHGCALDDAAAKLEELAIQERVAWATRRTGIRSDEGEDGALASSAAADAAALMVRTVRILVRFVELELIGPEDRPSHVLRVRRSVNVLQNWVFGSELSSRADTTFRVKPDAIRPYSLDDLQRLMLFDLHITDPDDLSRFLKSRGMLRCFRPILPDDKRALQLQPFHGPQRIITRDAISKVLQQWVNKELHHECAKQIICSNIYGREDVLEGITKQLLSNDNSRRSTFICLAAKRGFGKTTLVRSVYNDQRVSDAFDLRL